mmetsp:Transcript_8931/g.15644  ORF Transcript_8931/g.15644 Transcript_8931/m.15644 type:complete len:80 (-) Transcript_8931:108-347(-)
MDTRLRKQMAEFAENLESNASSFKTVKARGFMARVAKSQTSEPHWPTDRLSEVWQEYLFDRGATKTGATATAESSASEK